MPNEKRDDLSYHLGALEGRVSSLLEMANATNGAISRLDERLRKNESDTTALMVKMAALSTIAGGVGSVLMQLAASSFGK